MAETSFVCMSCAQRVDAEVVPAVDAEKRRSRTVLSVTCPCGAVAVRRPLDSLAEYASGVQDAVTGLAFTAEDGPEDGDDGPR